jgi:hypothetical protein
MAGRYVIEDDDSQPAAKPAASSRYTIEEPLPAPKSSIVPRAIPGAEDVNRPGIQRAQDISRAPRIERPLQTYQQPDALQALQYRRPDIQRQQPQQETGDLLATAAALPRPASPQVGALSRARARMETRGFGSDPSAPAARRQLEPIANILEHPVGASISGAMGVAKGATLGLMSDQVDRATAAMPSLGLTPSKLAEGAGEFAGVVAPWEGIASVVGNTFGLVNAGRVGRIATQAATGGIVGGEMAQNEGKDIVGDQPWDSPVVVGAAGAGLLSGALEIPAAVRSSEWWRMLTNKERGLVVQSLDDVRAGLKGQGWDDGRVEAKIARLDPETFQAALKKRIQVEGYEPPAQEVKPKPVMSSRRKMAQEVDNEGANRQGTGGQVSDSVQEDMAKRGTDEDVSGGTPAPASEVQAPESDPFTERAAKINERRTASRWLIEDEPAAEATPEPVAQEQKVDKKQRTRAKKAPAAEPVEQPPVDAEPGLDEVPAVSLKPAIRSGQDTVVGEAGSTHPEVLAANEDLPADAERGFVAGDGEFMTRAEAKTWLKENDPATFAKFEEIDGGELHSQDLNKATNEVAKQEDTKFAPLSLESDGPKWGKVTGGKIEPDGSERDKIAKNYADSLGQDLSGFHRDFADAVQNKDARRLQYLANGLNEKGKQAFTAATGVKLPKLQGKTWEALMDWGGLDPAKEGLIDAHTKSAKAHSRAKKDAEAVKIGDSNLAAKIDELFDAGYTEYRENPKEKGRGTEGGLYNPENGEGRMLRGKHINPDTIKDYAKTKAMAAKAKAALYGYRPAQEVQDGSKPVHGGVGDNVSLSGDGVATPPASAGVERPTEAAKPEAKGRPTGLVGDGPPVEQPVVVQEAKNEGAKTIPADPRSAKDPNTLQGKQQEVKRKAANEKIADAARKMDAEPEPADNYDAPTAQLAAEIEDDIRALETELNTLRAKREKDRRSAMVPRRELDRQMKVIEKKADELGKKQEVLEAEREREDAFSVGMQEAIDKGLEKAENPSAPPVTIPSIPSDLANRAFNGTSHSPERRGQSFREGFRQELTDIWQQFEKRYNEADEDRQAAFIDTFNTMAAKYGDMSRAYLSSHGNVMSAMIVGPARFPTDRNRKKMDAADNKMTEALEYIRKMPGRLNKVLTGTLPEEAPVEAVEPTTEAARSAYESARVTPEPAVPDTAAEVVKEAVKTAKGEGTPLKEQKKYLLANIEEAVKSAPDDNSREQIALRNELDELRGGLTAANMRKAEAASKLELWQNPEIFKDHSPEDRQEQVDTFQKALDVATADQDRIQPLVKDAQQALRDADAYVTIHVPDDGTFEVYNTKGALKAFKAQVDKLFPAAESRGGKTGYGNPPKPSAVKAEGLEGGFQMPATNGLWHGNGHVMVKGKEQVPFKGKEGDRFAGRTPEENQDAINRVTPKPTRGKPVTKTIFTAFGAGDKKLDNGKFEASSDQPIKLGKDENGYVRLKDAEGKTADVDQKYYVYAKQHFPKAEIRINGPDESVISVENGEVVAIVMPMRQSVTGGVLDRVIAKHNGQQTLDFMGLQQAYESLRKLAKAGREAMPHLEAIGRAAYEEGARKWQDFARAMREKLGDLWQKFKGMVEATFERVKRIVGNEVGAVGRDIKKAMRERYLDALDKADKAVEARDLSAADEWIARADEIEQQFMKMSAPSAQPEPAAVEPEPVAGELQEEDQRTTSTKNAVTEEERAERGLDPVEQHMKYTDPVAYAEGMKLVNDPGYDPREQAKALAEKPRPISAAEQVALLHDRVKIRNDSNSVMELLIEAQESGDSDRALKLRQRLAALEDNFNDNDVAARRVGTEWSASGRARQLLMAEDYSYIRTANRVRAAIGKREIPEEIRARIESLTKQLEEALAQSKAHEERIAELEAQRRVRQMRNEEDAAPPEVKRRRAAKKADRSGMDAEFHSLADKFRVMAGKLSMNIDPEMAVVLAEMARNRVIAGITDAKEIIADIYEDLKDIPDLEPRDIRDAISGYGESFKMSQDEINVNLREARRQMRLISALEDAEDGVIPAHSGLQRDAVSEKVRELQKEIKEAMRESGIDSTSTRSPEQQWKTALDAAKTRLKNQIHDITEELKTGKKAGKKVIGLKYDEEANTLKAVRDRLKKSLDEIEGKKGMSDEQRVRAAESAVQKSISDYERRIAQYDLKPRPKGAPAVETPALKMLRARRDALAEQFKQMQKDARPTKDPMEAALKAYKTRTMKRAADLQEMLTTGNFEKRARRVLQMDPESERLKERVAKLKEQVDAEVYRLERQNRGKLEKYLEFQKKAQRGAIFSTLGVIWKISASAAVWRPGFATAGNAMASAIRLLPPLRKIYEGAPRHGSGLNVKAEAAGYVQLFRSEMYRNFWDRLKQGKDGIQIKYAKHKKGGIELASWGVTPLDHAEYVLDFPGRAHSALKSIAYIQEFYKSLQYRTEWAIRNDWNMNDEIVRHLIFTAAEADANEAQFMADNVVNNIWRSGIGQLKKHGLGGMLSASLIEAQEPVMKVPLNAVGETFSYIPPVGTVKALTQLAAAAMRAGKTAKAKEIFGRTIGQAYQEAVDEMTEEEKENFAKNLNRAGIGVFLLGIGYALYKEFGGFYKRGEKRKVHDLKPGEARIFGVNAPANLLSFPGLSVIQVGSMIHHVEDLNKRREDKREEKAARKGEPYERNDHGFAEGVQDAAMGVAEEVPFVSSPLRLYQAAQSYEGMSYYSRRLLESLILPSSLPQIANKMDKFGGEVTVPRKGGFAQDVPFLRQKLPLDMKKVEKMPLDQLANIMENAPSSVTDQIKPTFRKKFRNSHGLEQEERERYSDILRSE